MNKKFPVTFFIYVEYVILVNFQNQMLANCLCRLEVTADFVPGLEKIMIFSKRSI